LRISKIFLYDEPTVPELNISSLAEFIKNVFSVEVEIRENIFSMSRDSTSERLATTKIFEPKKPFKQHNPTAEEIQFEKNNCRDSSKTENIIMYDGFEMQKIVSDLVPPVELDSDIFHVVFTNKLTCTFDYSDYRYHGRAVICANPSIISTTGIIEAPAKPREYYMELITNMTQGLNIEHIKKKHQGAFLEYHDTRLSTIIEGYVMQAIFYYITGEPFCDSPQCRLHNSHWQKDLL